ncbi:hypothetical protein BDN72DRAFT_894457 [Pluteus cervinus]|uniref:Uncharacterized protein n=1 Tax=Pluteus cervinus TaxID=181527 RepID=A0ACD3B584_9AGAR|nr:hypothetical protein BDN72DRAFT_894457 [Pluteus cervinus]
MLQEPSVPVVHQCSQVSIEQDLLGRYEVEHAAAEGCDPKLSAAEKRCGFPTLWTIAEVERWWKKPILSCTRTTTSSKPGTPVVQPPNDDLPPPSHPPQASPPSSQPLHVHPSISKPPTNLADSEPADNNAAHAASQSAPPNPSHSSISSVERSRPNPPSPPKKPRAWSLATLQKKLSITKHNVDGTEGVLEFEHDTSSAESRPDPLSKYNRTEGQPILEPPGAGKWTGPLPFFSNETTLSTSTTSTSSKSVSTTPLVDNAAAALSLDPTTSSATPAPFPLKPTSTTSTHTPPSLTLNPTSPAFPSPHDTTRSASPLALDTTSPSSLKDTTTPTPPKDAPSDPKSETGTQANPTDAPYTFPLVKGSASPFAPAFSVQEFRARLRKLLNWPVLPPTSKSKGDSQPRKRPRCEVLEEDLEEGELLPEEEEEESKGSEKRRKNGKKKFRGGKSHRERLALGLDRLSYRTVTTMRRTEYMRSSGFSITDDGIATTTGWSGRELPYLSREQITRAHEDIRKNDILAGILRGFSFAYFDKETNRPLFLVDRDGRIFFFRTSIQYWMEGPGHVLCGQEGLIAGDVPQTVGEEKHNRGRHAPVIVGHQRPYSEEIMLTMHHRKHATTVNTYIRSDAFLCIVNWVCCIVMYAFPAVAARYLACAEYWAAKGITPHFGLFWCYCWNACYKNQPRIHCQPHMDSKNVVGVCVVVVYEKPGYQFDHKTRSWLVIWDAGIIVEMPPWTAAVYPSSLFLHFNVDLQDIKVLTLPGGDVPTVEDRARFEERNMEGRGSIVFFNQANMFHYPELGFPSVKKAEQAHAPSTRDYREDAAVVFPASNIPSDLV